MCTKLVSDRFALQTIEPNLLLTAFLPVLLFAAAFGLEWHYVRRQFLSALLLAGMKIVFRAHLP